MAKATSTLRIRVVPDEKAPMPDPLVLLTARDVKAPGTPSRIVWRKLAASKQFKMISLVDQNEESVFNNIVVSNKKIECDFEPPASDPAGTDYSYTLTIEYKGTQYNTDSRVPIPAGGKAVIRN